MLARPRTNVAQWHALKAWSHYPASSMASSCLLSSPRPSPPPTPVLMHKTDLLPGCETRVQLAICSLKPLNSFSLFFENLYPSPTLHSSSVPPLIRLCLNFSVSPLCQWSPCFWLSVCLSVLMHFACGGLIFSFFVDPLVLNCTAAPDPLKVPVPWDHRES